MGLTSIVKLNASLYHCILELFIKYTTRREELTKVRLERLGIAESGKCITFSLVSGFDIWNNLKLRM